jgi:hypothetical protein
MARKLTEITNDGWECWYKNSIGISFINYDALSIETSLINQFISYVHKTYNIQLYLDYEDIDDNTIINFKTN